MKKHIFPLLLLVALVSCNDVEFEENDENEIEKIPSRARFLKVDYNPAPGQFINEIPRYEKGDTRESMNAKALEALNKGSLISLGALGGSVTLTLAEPIYHDSSSDADFRVLGNSYLTGSKDNLVLGSSEPGMVWIMKDENGNGIPDDTWYRFTGDMENKIQTLTITYTPVANPTPAKWVTWVNTDGKNGTLTCNTAYHDHTYFPMWLFDDPDKAEMTFTADALPANGFLDEESGMYRQICYPGFADAFPNNDIRSAFSLRDAVDLNGTRADIDRVDFIRIVTAVIDSNGPLGETSTEVGGIELLH